MNVNPLNSTVAAAHAQTPAGLPPRRDMIAAVQAISATDVFGSDRELAFVISRSAGAPVMRVIDRKTNEVVLQVPAAYLLQLAKELRQKP
jgi:hypothetical protein